MGIDRRATVKAGLAAGAVVAAGGTGAARAAGGGGVVELRGGDAVRGTIPRRRGRLELDVRQRPHAGWFAEYEPTAPAAGTYRLEATATVPVEHPQAAQIGSYVALGVNGGPCREVAHSQPHWYGAEYAGGDLCRAVWRDVELREGVNSLIVRVEEQAVLDGRTAYRLRLDRFTLTPVPVEVAEAEWDGAALRLRLNGPAGGSLRVPCRVTDYFGEEAAEGEVTFAAGRRTAVLPLPELPPGHYRVRAGGLLTRFAVFPEGRPGPGAADRFGVNAFAFSLIPPSRLDRFAAQMRAMGAGYVRDGAPWPVVEADRGTYDTAAYDRVTAAYRRHGLRTVEVVSPPPEWAMTLRSLPLPDDLRDAYRYGRHLALQRPGADAVQVSNEPDVDESRSTGDAHAAYVKALALGLRDVPRGPAVVLPGIAEAGSPFQRLMLRSEVARYAHAWGFHGYPDPAEQDRPEFPGAAREQHELLRSHGWEGMPAWMTESGVFIDVPQGSEPTAEQERVQARYLVRSLVQGLAEGNARQLWFDGPPTHDEGVWFSLLARDFAPLAACSAHAALTRLLGEARFVRPVMRATGYVFADASGRTVTVVWADEPQAAESEIPAPGGRVDVYDVMGRHRETVHSAGNIRLRLSPDPLYLVTAEAGHDAAAPPERPGEQADPGRSGAPPELSDADRVVLNQRWPRRNAAPGKDNGDAPPPYGYRLGRTTRMTLEVYNFADREQHVEVRAIADGDWDARPVQQANVKVPAHDRARIAFTVRAGSEARTDRDHTLTFEATTGGRQATPSVSWIRRR